MQREQVFKELKAKMCYKSRSIRKREKYQENIRKTRKAKLNQKNNTEGYSFVIQGNEIIENVERKDKK